MNATAVHARHRHHPAGDTPPTHAKHRRRQVVVAVGAGLLGLYFLGVGWFANELGTEMERNLQLAPAVQDVAHR